MGPWEENFGCVICVLALDVMLLIELKCYEHRNELSAY
jgi:hypothetical protein